MPRRAVFWAIALCAVAAAAAQAWALRWTCDDAYISLRYAQHFVAGHGLVYNLDPNEAPVEGYTNFAWTMWLALGMQLGCTGDLIEIWSMVWGTIFHGGTVLLLAAAAWRASGGAALAPIAACGYAALHHAASLAPAGLETALFTLLATAMLRLCLLLRSAREAWLLGFLGVLLAMTRPDGALFVAVAGLFVLHDAWRRRSVRLLLGYALPFLLVFVPYLLWRRLHYGDWVPNTFHAKSAADPYPSQGLAYVWEFGKCYWALLPVLAVPLYWVLRRPDPLASVSPFLGRRPWLAILCFVVPYTGFVVWVGGDFMFGRFLLPILPALLLSLDLACLRWRPLWLQPALGAALAGGLLLRAEPPWLGVYDNPHGFSDNRAISVKEFAPGLPWTEAMRFAGNYLRGVCAGLPVRVGIVGSHANLAFRAEVPVAVECAAGLTDARIARTEVAVRGTPGHEKGWALHLDYLIRERRLHFMLDLSFKTGDLCDAWREVTFPVLPARLVTYDRALLQELKRRDPNIVFTDVEAELDAYLAELPKKTKAEVARDFEALRGFYFDVNDDPARKRRFEEFLR
ncbi:MAG: hypothetical protein FJ265_01270 [Planctomycetes bacterium]|nr:hypothetical protein [Planctomycetota bacterium]